MSTLPRDVVKDCIKSHEDLESHCKETYDRTKVGHTPGISVSGTQYTRLWFTDCPHLVLRPDLLLRHDSDYVETVLDQWKADTKRKKEQPRNKQPFNLTKKFPVSICLNWNLQLPVDQFL